MGLMENNLLGAQQETRLRVEELEDRWGGGGCTALCCASSTQPWPVNAGCNEAGMCVGLMRGLGCPRCQIDHPRASKAQLAGLSTCIFYSSRLPACPPAYSVH
jgi:hypothetical protein